MTDSTRDAKYKIVQGDDRRWSLLVRSYANWTPLATNLDSAEAAETIMRSTILRERSWSPPESLLYDEDGKKLEAAWR